jgi:hypothetical protein
MIVTLANSHMMFASLSKNNDMQELVKNNGMLTEKSIQARKRIPFVQNHVINNLVRECQN